MFIHPHTNMTSKRCNTAGTTTTGATKISKPDHDSLPAERAPLFTRIKYFVKLWAIKLPVAVSFKYFRFLYPSPATKPTMIKPYACRPSLSVRLFTPEPKVANGKNLSHSEDSFRPLYIDIHGGGFAIGDAEMNDHFASSWCKRTGMIVASLNYRKAPLHPFPTALHDIATAARAVIDDESLSIDESRVVIGGFSAGGNLAFAASLLSELQGMVKAVVSYYPILDFTTTPEEKFAIRLNTEKPTELMGATAPAFNWGYVRIGQDKRDKLLSPCFAAQDELPEFVCMVGAQHDALCREARDMVCSLAGEKLDDESWEEGFERENYKWILVKGVRHGFAEGLKPGNPQSAWKREKCAEVYEEVHGWLQEKVLL